MNIVMETKTTKKTGKVKWFNNQKGYGFIIQDNGTEIFVHFKDVDGAIGDNDDVEFEVSDGRKGPQAINVKKV